RTWACQVLSLPKSALNLPAFAVRSNGSVTNCAYPSSTSMPPLVMERKKFPFAYGSIKAWNATSASSRFIGRRMSFAPNSYGFGCPTLPRKLPMTEVSGLKTFDAPGSDGLLTVVTSPMDGGGVPAADAAG